MEGCFRLLLAVCLVTGLVVADCPSGWISHRGSCYFFSIHNANWYEAGYTCQAIHSQRVTIDSDDKNNFIGGMLIHFRGAFRSDTFWLDGSAEGTSDGSYEWVSSKDPVVYTNWAKNEPNSTIGDCIVIKNRMWETRNCNNSNGFICELSNIQRDCSLPSGPIVG